MSVQLPDPTLLSYLEGIPDYRKARGKQYLLKSLLTLLCAGLVSGQKTVRGIAHWVQLHGDELSRLLPDLRSIPSFSTLYRLTRFMNVAVLEQKIQEYGQAVDIQDSARGGVVMMNGEILRGQALDGKELRGASAHGETVAFLSLVRHESGTILGEEPVASKTNEIPVARSLLAGRDLSGTVTTADALHTQRATAQQILDQNGHYLMVVKPNQPDLWNAIDLLFRSEPLKGEDDRWTMTYTQKRHGRIETRTITSTCGLGDYLNWPGANQVLSRHYHSVERKTGKVRDKITYGITDLTRQLAGPEHIEAFWRGHWTIENRSHYVRDETMGEDRCQTHCGAGAQVLVALRNGIVSMFRYEGWENIAAAIRVFGSSVQKSLTIIGAITT